MGLSCPDMSHVNVFDNVHGHSVSAHVHVCMRACARAHSGACACE